MIMASRSRKKKWDEPGALGRGASATGRGLKWCARRAAVPLLAAAIYVAGVWCLWQYAAREAVRPTDPQIDAAECSWLEPRDVAEINSAVRFGGRATLYDRDICDRVAARYAENAWVEEVVAVRRQFPDRVVVELAIREPFAYVRRGGRYYLVDRRGCRLPMKPVRRPERGRPVIRGIRAPLSRPGEPWEGRPLADSLRLAGALAAVLEGRGAGLRLSSVEVIEEKGSFDSLPQMVARTASGLVIDWGSYNQSRTYLYPSAEEKCREIEKVLDRVGDPAAIEAIMVRYKGHSLRMRADWSAANGAGARG